jgi:phosphate transport system permease protein
MTRQNFRLKEWFWTIVTWGVAATIVGVLIWLLGDLLWHGIDQLNWQFLTTAPRDVGREGGIAPILVSTILILFVCLSICLPLGLGTAVLLTEFTTGQSWFAWSINLSLDVLAGVPSIVFGLFGNAFFCKMLGLGFSILSGGLTLACMVLPSLIQSIQQGLQDLPEDYRRSAAALGLTRIATLCHLLLPAATPGLIAGVLLGLGRASAETAALIFTSGYVDRMPESLWDSGRSLSVHIYDLAMNVSGGEPQAYTSALVLVGFLVVINGSISWLAERFQQSKIHTS